MSLYGDTWKPLKDGDTITVRGLSYLRSIRHAAARELLFEENVLPHTQYTPPRHPDDKSPHAEYTVPEQRYEAYLRGRLIGVGQLWDHVCASHGFPVPEHLVERYRRFRENEKAALQRYVDAFNARNEVLIDELVRENRAQHLRRYEKKCEFYTQYVLQEAERIKAEKEARIAAEREKRAAEEAKRSEEEAARKAAELERQEEQAELMRRIKEARFQQLEAAKENRNQAVAAVKATEDKLKREREVLKVANDNVETIERKLEAAPTEEELAVAREKLREDKERALAEQQERERGARRKVRVEEARALAAEQARQRREEKEAEDEALQQRIDEREFERVKERAAQKSREAIAARKARIANPRANIGFVDVYELNPHEREFDDEGLPIRR